MLKVAVCFVATSKVVYGNRCEAEVCTISAVKPKPTLYPYHGPGENP